MSLFNDQEKKIRVLLPLPLAGSGYDYLCPPHLSVAEGDFVLVPLGKQTRLGVVWSLNDHDSSVAPEKLKAVIEKLDHPPLPSLSRTFVDWVAKYTLQPLGAVLKMTFSLPEALDPAKPQITYVPPKNLPADFKRTKTRQRVLDVLAASPSLTATDLAQEAAVSPSVIRTMAQQGALTALASEPASPFQTPDWQQKGVTLSADQQQAADQLCAQDGYNVHLLDGVPGAGKTEVYFEAVAKALAQGQQVLVLLPEIALSSQWLTRFKRRFGCEPAVWHSDIGQSKRKATWRAVIRGQASVIVGARSALFLPFKDLGLIIVDEEHDASFKQEDGVIYNGRDMAVVRGQLGKCPVILASATPSLESMVNGWNHRYQVVPLHNRHANRPLPHVETIDLRLDKPERQKWLSPRLIKMIGETVERGEQVMLYLNRRGYAPLTLCRTCGHRMQCPHCTSWLVEHRRTNRLQCHHCGFHSPKPRHCPSCEDEDSFAACGPGVERLSEEVAETFPDLKHVVAASDTITSPTQAAQLIEDIENRHVDILIGTQMMAKGYHFPLLTLVGVIDADLGLAGGDLRAAERTYQLLYQVAGRAGRGEHSGQVYLQTTMPDHPVMQALCDGNRDTFLEAEAKARQTALMPPFGRLAALIVSGEDEILVDDTANTLGRNAPHTPNIQVLGPAPAPLAMIRGRHRRRLLVKADKRTALQPLIRHWLGQITIPRTVRVQIDIDPYSFL